MLLTSLTLGVLALPSLMAQQIFDVSVGANGNLAYNPPFVTAIPGDLVNFVFHAKNHTATQSTFPAPCVYDPTGFDSGFHPVSEDQVNLPNFAVTVNDTSPVWVYCRQVGHCGAGMVFAINPPSPPSPNTLDAFVALAIAINGTNSTQSAVNSTETASNATKTSWNSTETSSNGTTHMVTVGQDGLLRYNPTNITANPGDSVEFTFYPKNHTVSQSNFEQPCQPFVDTSPNQTIGFDSGFMPVSANDNTPHTFTIVVNDTKPIWAYCRQEHHCGQGMVFSINAPAVGNTFEAFLALAEKINGTTNGTSSETSPPSYGGSVSGSATPSPSGSSWGSSNSGGSSPSSDLSTAKDALDNVGVGSSSAKVNTYIIIGLLSAVLVGLVMLAAFLFFRRNRSYKPVPNTSIVAPEILPYSQKGPYETPYGSADPEEYRD